MWVQVDPSVSFDQVGGLEHYIKALKEMVFLPLVYPELFERFHLSPPRGVLFYGPPGMYCKETSLALCLLSFADLLQLLSKAKLSGFCKAQVHAQLCHTSVLPCLSKQAYYCFCCCCLVAHTQLQGELPYKSVVLQCVEKLCKQAGKQCSAPAVAHRHGHVCRAGLQLHVTRPALHWLTVCTATGKTFVARALATAKSRHQ